MRGRPAPKANTRETTAAGSAAVPRSTASAGWWLSMLGPLAARGGLNHLGCPRGNIAAGSPSASPTSYLSEGRAESTASIDPRLRSRFTRCRLGAFRYPEAPVPLRRRPPSSSRRLQASHRRRTPFGRRENGKAGRPCIIKRRRNYRLQRPQPAPCSSLAAGLRGEGRTCWQIEHRQMIRAAPAASAAACPRHRSSRCRKRTRRWPSRPMTMPTQRCSWISRRFARLASASWNAYRATRTGRCSSRESYGAYHGRSRRSHRHRPFSPVRTREAYSSSNAFSRRRLTRWRPSMPSFRPPFTSTTVYLP